MARISTHVLNIARGKPVAGMAVRLYREAVLAAAATTNADGRTTEPLLSGDSLETGTYELVFETGGAFFDEITIRFKVSEAQGNYHVPLLLAPYGYSTYRGS